MAKTDWTFRVSRVHPGHVNGPDAVIVEMDGGSWAPARFGLTFEQARHLAEVLLEEVGHLDPEPHDSGREGDR